MHRDNDDGDLEPLGLVSCERERGDQSAHRLGGGQDEASAVFGGRSDRLSPGTWDSGSHLALFGDPMQLPPVRQDEDLVHRVDVVEGRELVAYELDDPRGRRRCTGRQAQLKLAAVDKSAGSGTVAVADRRGCTGDRRPRRLAQHMGESDDGDLGRVDDVLQDAARPGE